MVSVPYLNGRKDLKFIEYSKDEISPTPEKLIKHHKNNLLRFEQGMLQSNKRMRIINSVQGTLKR